MEDVKMWLSSWVADFFDTGLETKAFGNGDICQKNYHVGIA
jgi:hypothetical protein